MHLHVNPGPSNIQHLVESKQTQERYDVNKQEHNPDGVASPVLPPLSLALARVRPGVLLEGDVEIVKLPQSFLVHRTSTGDQ